MSSHLLLHVTRCRVKQMMIIHWQSIKVLLFYVLCPSPSNLEKKLHWRKQRQKLSWENACVAWDCCGVRWVSHVRFNCRAFTKGGKSLWKIGKRLLNEALNDAHTTWRMHRVCQSVNSCRKSVTGVIWTDLNCSACPKWAPCSSLVSSRGHPSSRGGCSDGGGWGGKVRTLHMALRPSHCSII